MLGRSVGQVFCRMSLHWNMSDALITNGLGLWAAGRRLERHTAILALSGFLF